MNPYWHTQALIIKSRDFKDSDKLVTIFSESVGKLTAVAKGVKKPKSSLRACVQPFCHSRLQLNHGRSMDVITQGKILNFFGNSREELNRTLQSMYLMELLDKGLMEETPFPELYQSLLFVLERIDQRGEQPLLIHYFEAQLLKHNGYHPVLDYCVRCETPLQGSRRISPAEGGAICELCWASPTGQAGMVDGETIALLRQLFAAPAELVARLQASALAQQQLERTLNDWLEYYLERRSQTKEFIRYFKQCNLAEY